MKYIGLGYLGVHVFHEDFFAYRINFVYFSG